MFGLGVPELIVLFLIIGIPIAISQTRRNKQSRTNISPSINPTTQGTTLNKYCHACGGQIDFRAEICPKCGVRQALQSGKSERNRVTAALFAIFLGGLGIHKFYLGSVGMGVVYLLFCWTFIPSIIGFIGGIIFLTMSDAAFNDKYNA